MTRPTPQKANDMSTTEFRITGPGWYMTRDGRRVFVSGSDMHNSEYYPWRYGATLIAEHGGYWYCRSQPEPEDIVSRCPDAPPAPAPEPKEEAETLFVCDFCGATKPHAAKLPDGWLSRYSTSDGVRRTACDKHDCWVKEDEDYKARLPQATTRLERAKAALEEAKAARAAVSRSCEENWNADRARLSAAEHQEYLAKKELAAAESEARTEQPAAPQVTDEPFPIGTPVAKVGGDYSYTGEVRAIVIKRSGAVRYVVEGTQDGNMGMLFIMNANQLKAIK